MKNLEFYSPTRVIFGSNILDSLGETTKKFGTRAMFVYGRSSIKKSGLHENVLSLLKRSGISPVILMLTWKLSICQFFNNIFQF